MTRASLSIAAAVLAAPMLVLGCQAIVGIHHDVELVPSDATTDGNDDAMPETTLDDSGDAARDSQTDGVPAEAGAGCPKGRGPDMVKITITSGTAFCIDSTEVTEQQFREFELVTTKPTPPARCAGVVAKPFEDWQNLGPNYPRAYVNWCQAWQFCAWAGKRLCGSQDGKPTKPGGTPTEWQFACSQGTSTVYPYGNTLDNTRCNGGPADCDASSPMLAPVEAKATCNGTAPPYSFLFDMSGNVGEYIDACDDTGNPDDGGPVCAVRGGSVYDCKADNLACTSEGMPPVDLQSDSLGFRCCATPLGF